MTMYDPATHDLFGNYVDSWFWQLGEESFKKEVEAFQSVGNGRAAAIAERLVSTTNEYPCPADGRICDLWNDDTYIAMVAEIGRSAFIPADATAFCVEFICRRTKPRGS
jgi:hypothetical protein